MKPEWSSHFLWLSLCSVTASSTVLSPALSRLNIESIELVNCSFTATQIHKSQALAGWGFFCLIHTELWSLQYLAHCSSELCPQLRDMPQQISNKNRSVRKGRVQVKRTKPLNLIQYCDSATALERWPGEIIFPKSQATSCFWRWKDWQHLTVRRKMPHASIHTFPQI